MGVRRIVVGVDGSEGGRRALDWAIREAVEVDASIRVVSAYRFDDLTIAAGGLDAERRRAEDLVGREIESVPGYARAGMTIDREVAEGRAGTC